MLTHRCGGGDPRMYMFRVDKGNGPVAGLHSFGRPDGRFNTAQRSDRRLRELEDVISVTKKATGKKTVLFVRHGPIMESVKPAELVAPVSSVLLADQQSEGLPSIMMLKPEFISAFHFRRTCFSDWE